MTCGRWHDLNGYELQHPSVAMVLEDELELVVRVCLFFLFISDI